MNFRVKIELDRLRNFSMLPVKLLPSCEPKSSPFDINGERKEYNFFPNLKISKPYFLLTLKSNNATLLFGTLVKARSVAVFYHSLKCGKRQHKWYLVIRQHTDCKVYFNKKNKLSHGIIDFLKKCGNINCKAFYNILTRLTTTVPIFVFQIHNIQVPFSQRTVPVFCLEFTKEEDEVKAQISRPRTILAAAKDIFIAKQSLPSGITNFSRRNSERKHTHLDFRQAAKAAHIYPQAQSHGLCLISRQA